MVALKYDVEISFGQKDLSGELSVDRFEIVGAAQKEIPGFSKRFIDMFFRDDFIDGEHEYTIGFVMRRLEGDYLKDYHVMHDKIVVFLKNYLGVK